MPCVKQLVSCHASLTPAMSAYVLHAQQCALTSKYYYDRQDA